MSAENNALPSAPVASAPKEDDPICFLCGDTKSKHTKKAADWRTVAGCVGSYIPAAKGEPVTIEAAQGMERSNEADFAEILPSERSTSSRLRDATSSSTDSSSVPSARTVTRYTFIADTLVDEEGTDAGHVFERGDCFVKWFDVSPLLTALADKETENATLKAAMEIDAEDFIRAVDVSHEQTDQITALTARAEAAEADVVRLKTSKSIWCMHCLADWPVKDAPDAIESAKAHELICPANPLTAQLQAAEATITTLGEEFQRHKDLSFTLFTDAVDRADQSEATIAHLREAANVALSFLRHLTDDAKGLAGATAERTLLAATEGKP